MLRLVLKKKHDKGDEESRYDGTILGKESEPHIIPVEGGEITSLKEWADMLHKRATAQGAETNGLRRASSELSSIDDQEMSGMDL
jgi:transcription initiation factor TFIID subunit 3